MFSIPSWINYSILSTIIFLSFWHLFTKWFGLNRIFSILWPLVAIYLGLFLFYDVLQPAAGSYRADVISSSIPLFVLAYALFQHWLSGQVFSVLLAIIGNFLAGCYNLWYLYIELGRHFPNKMGKPLIQFLNNQDWFIICLYLFPFLAASLAFRYLWTHPLALSHLKGGWLKKLDSHGTARFANRKNLKAIQNPEGLPIGIAPKRFFNNPQKTIQLLKNEKGTEIIRIKADHTTVIAPSGAGKGIGVVIPALLDYKGPVFVTDIKGENYAVTKKARMALGRKVIAFDPFEITDSPKLRINPLAFLNPHSKEIVDDTATLANLICPIIAQDGSNASYFQSQAAAAVQCLLLYVVCSNDIEPSNKNLACVYNLLCLPESELIELLSQIGQDESLGFGTAARLANRIVSTDPRERSGILNSACVEMRFVDSPYVRESISASDIVLSDITKGDIDLYICIPPHKLETQSRLLRLMTGIVFLEMQNARGKLGTKKLLMVIDEMPALGYMKQIEQILGYGRGYGISLMAISQTIELIRGVYPKSWETFFSNQLSVFFGCADPMTCEFVSKMIGKTTIETSSSNRGSSKQVRSVELVSSSSTQTGSSFSETGRQLLMPEEIKALGDKVVLAFLRGESPIMCQRIDYRDRVEWKKNWDKNPLHLLNPLEST